MKKNTNNKTASKKTLATGMIAVLSASSAIAPMSAFAEGNEPAAVVQSEDESAPAENEENAPTESVPADDVQESALETAADEVEPPSNAEDDSNKAAAEEIEQETDDKESEDGNPSSETDSHTMKISAGSNASFSDKTFENDIIVEEGATLSLDKCVLTGTITLYEKAQVNLKDSKLIADSNRMIHLYGESVLNMENTDMLSEYVAATLIDNYHGTVNIDGGTFTAEGKKAMVFGNSFGSNFTAENATVLTGGIIAKNTCYALDYETYATFKDCDMTTTSEDKPGMQCYFDSHTEILGDTKISAPNTTAIVVAGTGFGGYNNYTVTDLTIGDIKALDNIVVPFSAPSAPQISGRVGIGTVGTAPGSNVIINSGTITGTDNGIYHINQGKLTINGGTISGATALHAKMGDITLNNGELIATGAPRLYRNVLALSDDSASDGSAVALLQGFYDIPGYDSKLNFTMNGGRLATTPDERYLEPASTIRLYKADRYEQQPYDVKINGGELSYYVSTYKVHTRRAGEELFTYPWYLTPEFAEKQRKLDAEAYCKVDKVGKYIDNGENGKWAIAAMTADGTYYPSLADAIDAVAITGGKIYYISDNGNPSVNTVPISKKVAIVTEPYTVTTASNFKLPNSFRPNKDTLAPKLADGITALSLENGDAVFGTESEVAAAAAAQCIKGNPTAGKDNTSDYLKETYGFDDAKADIAIKDAEALIATEKEEETKDEDNASDTPDGNEADKNDSENSEEGSDEFESVENSENASDEDVDENTALPATGTDGKSNDDSKSAAFSKTGDETSILSAEIAAAMTAIMGGAHLVRRRKEEN